MTCLHTRITFLRGRHCHNSHVTQADAARQLPGGINQRPRAVAERTEDLHQRLEEHRDEFREGRTAFPLGPTSTAVRVATQMVRQIALSRGDPGYTADLVALYR
jgi:uncharacterized MAPEG superfamily protein